MKTLLLVMFSAAAMALGGSADFEAGNKAYDEGKFLEARQHYEAAVASGEWHANLFHNLGNADERLGATGLAILNYERALALQPGHAEAQANLKFLREQSLSKTPKQGWKDMAFGALSFNSWVIATAVFGWSAVFMAAWPFARRRRLSAASLFLLVLLACTAGYAAYGACQTSGELDAGVIIAKQAEARQGPADRATLINVLPAGSRVRVLSVRGEWTYCTLPDGNTGWVPSSSVERIRLSS